MTNVIPFAKPVEETPHGTGSAFCMACSATWQGVAPVGTVELECPECKSMKGRFTFAYAPPSETAWECACGSQLFNVLPDGIFCPNCGVYQSFPKDLK
jgi:rubredoxin